MKLTVQMVEYRCNGCGKPKVVNEEIDGPPNGFHGTVAQITEYGGSGGVEFYACTSRCVNRAIQNAVQASYEA